MTKPFSFLRLFPRRHALPLTLVSCCLTAGCQTPGFATALSGKKTDAQTVSSTDETAQAGLPEPTNTATSNSPLSLSSVDEHLRLGEEELTRGNYQQAQLHFDHVLEKHPEHSKAHHRLGVLADKLSHFEQAEQHYLTALAGDPRNAALLSDLGYSYYMQGRNTDAERYLLEARRVDPQYDTAIANLGLLYGSTGRKQEALALFRQIGDDEQVNAIMQQIDGSGFGPSGQIAAAGETSQQSSVITTQTNVQQASTWDQRSTQGDAPQDFAAQLQQAREELRRAEEDFARHLQSQQSANVGLAQSTPSQHQPEQTSPSDAWAQQSPSSQQTPTQPAPWHQQQASAQQGQPMMDSTHTGALASNTQPYAAGPNTAAANVGTQYNSAPLPQVNPRPRHQSPQWETMPDGGSPASATGAPLASTVSGVATPVQSQGTFGQSPWGQPGSPAQPQPVPSQQQFNTAQTPQSPPPAAWGQQHATSIEQAGAQNAPPSSQGIQQLNGTAQPFGQRQPVEHAFHSQSPQAAQNNITLTGQDGHRAAGPLPQIAGQPAPESSFQAHVGANTAPPQANSYDEARRQAALMGLNAGPGQVFPSVQRYERVRTGASVSANTTQFSPAQPHAAATQMSAGNAPPSAYQPAPPPYQPSSVTPQPWQPQTPTGNQPAASAQSSQAGSGQPWGQPQPSASWATPPATTTTQNYRPTQTAVQPSTHVTPVPYYERPSAGVQGYAVPAGYQTTQPPASYPPQQATGGVVVPEAYPNRQPAPVPSGQQPANYSGQPYPRQQATPAQPAPRPYTGLTIVPGER